ncbi:hypothetical protein VPNG_00374 [Cytospora leucostoma]|uniref:Uncharacterized protein n=1 Tax=Cytospora leucostoma TaxID=1230097 RepID=A0A423XNC6_9PEZI|nr:hypothetical protein VPNG_00374 [Cytospora leucostoma]
MSVPGDCLGTPETGTAMDQSGRLERLVPDAPTQGRGDHYASQPKATIPGLLCCITPENEQAWTTDSYEGPHRLPDSLDPEWSVPLGGVGAKQ